MRNFHPIFIPRSWVILSYASVVLLALLIVATVVGIGLIVGTT